MQHLWEAAAVVVLHLYCSVNEKFYVFALCGDGGAMSYGNNNKNSGGGSGPARITRGSGL